MIIFSVHNRSFRRVSGCHEKVAEVNAGLTKATIEVLHANHHYGLNLPVYLNDVDSSRGPLISSFAMICRKASRGSDLTSIPFPSRRTERYP